MESRQRVSSILNSQAFREELESIIADQLKHGPHPASLIALQQISELLLPNTSSKWQQANTNGKGIFTYPSYPECLVSIGSNKLTFFLKMNFPYFVSFNKYSFEIK